jgi:signal transduction histidine kinase
MGAGMSYRPQLVLQLDPHLETGTRGRWIAVCLAMILAIAAADYATGYEISLSVLFLVPVFIGAWTLGRAGGITLSVLSAAAWYVVFLELHPHPSGIYHLLDALLRGCTWIIFALVIHRLKLALAHADERFVTVLEGLDAAVYVSDTETGELLYVNEQFRKAFPAGASPQAARENEGEFQDPGSKSWYLIRARAIRWVDGRMVRLHIATDITERKLAEEISRQQQEKLQMTARLITVGEMASTLAHEINQPLAAIANYNRGSVRRLRSGVWDATELIEAMEKSGEQAERAGRIIQRVREFVRKREPNVASCDVNEVITGVVRMIEIEAEKNTTKVKLALAPALPPVRADKVMIEQIILNLVKNAIEAMQDTAHESRELTIRTSPGASGAIEIEVADSGRGLSPQLEENLFTPFFTTKPEGMGMGLHICRSIIELHDGRLWANRNSAGGSTFHFTLPAARP